MKEEEGIGNDNEVEHSRGASAERVEGGTGATELERCERGRLGEEEEEDGEGDGIEDCKNKKFKFRCISER